jgi:hypothetical protein
MKEQRRKKEGKKDVKDKDVPAVLVVPRVPWPPG